MTFKRRRLATVDVGSNSVLFLAAERDEKGALTVLADESRITRLGAGIQATRTISEGGLERTCEALEHFASRAKELAVDEIHATATSAAREAQNRDLFLAEAARRSGLKVEVISPNEEARLTYLSVTTEPEKEEPSMVVDIGGGSTEITWGIGHRFDGGRSLDLGTVKLLEAFLSGDPPPAASIEAARQAVDARLARVTPLGQLTHHFGTAGSFTHLVSLNLGLTAYHSTKVSGHRLTRENVAKFVDLFSRTPKAEILKLPGVDPRRADVLLAGTLIIERLFAQFGVSAFHVFDRGVRFGKIFDLLRGFVPPIRFA
jgi:exopolyphosphatase/guanosine-5'-triphosphate,3'-diphosphate pyrophosphatase